MKEMLGADYPRYEASFEKAPARGLLVNTSKVDEAAFDALFPLHTRHIPYMNIGRQLLSEEKVGGDPLYAAGLYYMQDPGAMSSVAALPEIKGRVLDVAAAPGGKTIAAALTAGQDAFIVANEVNFSRAKILLQNVERMGLTNVAVTSLPPRDFARYTPESFDMIIADLPCSGEGMFRKEPQAVAAWNENINAMNAERQKEILSDVLPALKKGGRLLYSTCTYSLKENEEIVEYLIEKYDMRLLPLREEVVAATAPGMSIRGLDLTNARRFYPFIEAGEGQFFALLEKRGERIYTTKRIPPKVSINEEKRVREFLSKNLDADIPVINKQGEDYYAVHPLARTLPLRYLSEGVRLGELSGGKFLPHHNLFTAYGDTFYNREELDLDDPRVNEYLTGLEIDAKTAEEGYVAVRANGHTLGGGKCVGGRIKNHYPKGLRIR